MTPLTLADIVASRVRREQRLISRAQPARSHIYGGPSVSSVAQFDALNNSPNRTPIPCSIPEAMAAILGMPSSEGAYRESLCGLARWLVDNYGGVWYALDLIARYSAPVIPKAVSADPNWNKRADAYWDAWSDSCDFFGASDFPTISRLACLHMDMDGDIGAIMDGSSGSPQLRLVPSWRIGSKYGMRTSDGVVDGVVLDSFGRIVGYEVRSTKDKVDVFDRNQMILLVERERIERFRGLSPIRRGANDVRDARDILGFEKLATKMESAMAAVIEGAPQMESAWADSSQESTGMSGATANSSVTIAQMLGGEIPVIDGQFKQLQSTRPGTNKIDFLDTLAGAMCAGLGLPPSFYLDMKFTGPNTRAVIGKAQRRFDSRKAELAKLARWSWVRVIGDAIGRGELEPVDGWNRCRAQGPKEITIDLGDVAKADREAVMKGMMSRQAYFAKNNQDWEDETNQITSEFEQIIDSLKAISEKTGVSMDILMQAFGFSKGQPDPAPNQDNTQAP